jgi:hypothetical protein
VARSGKKAEEIADASPPPERWPAHVDVIKAKEFQLETAKKQESANDQLADLKKTNNPNLNNMITSRKGARGYHMTNDRT